MRYKSHSLIGLAFCLLSNFLCYGFETHDELVRIKIIKRNNEVNIPLPNFHWNKNKEYFLEKSWQKHKRQILFWVEKYILKFISTHTKFFLYFKSEKCLFKKTFNNVEDFSFFKDFQKITIWRATLYVYKSHFNALLFYGIRDTDTVCLSRDYVVRKFFIVNESAGECVLEN